MVYETDELKVKKHQLGHAYAYNMFASAGTINSLSCTASTAATLSNRWNYRAFSATNNANNVAQFNFEVPASYIDGRDIKIEIHFTHLDGTGGDIRWGIGLANASVGGDPFDGDTYTSFRETTQTVGAHLTEYDVVVAEHTFSGAGIKANDMLAVIVYRDTTAANPDTLGSTVYVNAVSIYSV